MLKIVEDVVIWDEKPGPGHENRVREVLKRCQEAGITLGQKKFVYAQPEVIWCGFKLSKDGYTVNPSLVDALRRFPVPATKVNVRSFCGLIQQFEVFSASISGLAEPLRMLLSPKTPFLWEGAQQAAFERLIELLTSPRVLTQYRSGAKLRLETDAAQTKGLGFALWQQDGSIYKLLQCGSRSITPTESRYSPTEIELLAVVWAAKKCALFLRGA